MANGNNGSKEAVKRAVRDYIRGVDVEELPTELVQSAIQFEDRNLVQEIRDAEDERRLLRSATEQMDVEVTLQPSLEQLISGLRQQRGQQNQPSI